MSQDQEPPARRLPPGATDCHCHVFGPAALYPWGPDRHFTPPEFTRERLFAVHRANDIDRAVIVQTAAHGTDNRVSLDAIAEAGPNYRGTALVEPTITDAELQALHAGGMRAVRFNRIYGEPPFEVIHALAERVRPLGWHVLLHVNAEDLERDAEQIAALQVPFVIDHMGRMSAADGLDQRPLAVLKALLQAPNAWIKISGADRLTAIGPPYADSVPFMAALLEAAEDRTIWGTDCPHPNVKGPYPKEADLIEALVQATGGGETLRRVTVDNPARLYGFEGAAA